MIISKFAPLALAMSLAFGSAAQAAITVYTDAAAFLAAVDNFGVDDFNDLAVSSTPGPLSRSAGTYGYTATVGSESTNFFPGSDDGTDIFLSTNNRFDTVVLDGFAPGIQAAGGFFFGSDINGFTTAATSITILATDSSGTVTEIALNPTTSTFRGFITDSTLVSLSFLIGDEIGVWPSLDNLHLGVVADGPVVPEPATWALMIAGFGMVGAAMRRRAVLTA
ncbi:PEPxxWA-CTERM sorting domain-containing protein [Glacieibacterium frigidum]|nr:PEPxxWA-CTERM sorting domain-containing protein [Glacieibacterium frigidum]